MSGHGLSRYINQRCRCTVCNEAHNAYMRDYRGARYAARYLVDGRLYAPNATHGKPNTYANYGCRCEPCSAAWRQRARELRSRAA
jgi:queuine/archaeosine tRNA-ribosyltransferase